MIRSASAKAWARSASALAAKSWELTSFLTDIRGIGSTASTFGGGITYQSAAGTAYFEKQSESGGWGTVLVDNNGYATDTNIFTHFPPTLEPGLSNELVRARVTVTNAAKFKLLADCEVGDIHVAADSLLDLNFKTLNVFASEHALSGTVTNYGEIIWTVRGTSIMVR